MPRKTNYRLDYDEGYDDDYDAYHDYDGSDDYEHGPDTKEDGKTSQQDKTFKKPVLWSCSICTYENDVSGLSCEICGVLREPSVASAKADEAKALAKVKVNGRISVTGASLSKPSQLALSDSSSTQYNPGQLGDYPSELSEERQSDYSSNSLAKERQLTQTKGNNIGVNNGTPQTLDNDLDSLNLERQLNQTKGDNTRFNKGAPQTLANDLDSLKFEKHFTRRKCDSQEDYKPEKGIFHDQEQEIHDQLNLAIVGHVDSGKSTLSGRLLHLLGRISKKEIHKYEKEAKVMGKGSFAYAWTMDESAEERERGVTMTVAVAYFDSKKYRVVLLDSPGHKDFVPNMISGATQADGAVLVVDASVGSFEAGMDGHGFGQTREHAQLIRSFGVEQLIVAINKMDLVDYGKERFNFIKMQLGLFLRSCGFKESSITWIPLSVMENQNLVTAASDVRLSSWYRGLSILDAIDSLQPPPRDVSKPLRLPICDVTKLHTTGQVAVSGKLQAGAVRNGSKVLVMPSGYLATVRSIERDSSACNTARAGDNVAISLLGIDPINLMQGGVLCHPDFPVAMAKKLELKILVLDITMPIIVGSHVEFHIHHAKEAARVAKIISLLDQKTGKVSKTAPRVLKSKQSAVMEVDLDGAVCVEEFSRCRALGRVFLRSSGNTIAVGIVTRVFEQEA